MRVGAQLLLTFLLNASWQIALLAAFASAGDWLLRGTAARYRHAMWIAALGLALALPLWNPAQTIKTLLSSKPAPVQTAAAPVFVTTVYSPDLDMSDGETRANPAPLTSAPARGNFLTSGIRLNKTLAIVLLALYGLMLLYRAGQLFRAWRRTKNIVRTAFECEFSLQVKRLIEQCQTATGVRHVRILCSKLVPVPSTVGIFNPLIILPERLLQNVDEEVLTSAIGHELVHVARRDYLTNLIYELIYLPLSFHPGAALLRRRIKQTRELCCDEAVASKLLRAEVYARSLVRLVSAAPLDRHLAMDTTIGISESDILEVRIMSLLKRPGLSASRKRLLLITAALLLAAPCVAATSFALRLDIDRQNPAVEPQAREKIDRQNQARVREELKRAATELKEKARVAPESQRAEIEARLLEVQRNLELHEKALDQYQQNREEARKKLEELRLAMAEWDKNRPANEARIKEAREEIAKLEERYTSNRAGDVQQALAEMQKTEGTRKARVIYRAEPEYTTDARDKQIAGTVVLTLTIDTQGLPQNIQLQKALYPSLDQSAIEAARKLRFQPAMKDGQPVTQEVSVEYNFAVESSSKQELEELEKRAVAGQWDDVELRRRKVEQERREETRSRRQADLTKGASLSMDRAIQIATSQVPGKVLACSLGRDGDKLFYHVIIIGGDGDKTTATYVWVSAIDGQILKTEKEERKDDEVSFERTSRSPLSGGVLNGSATSMPAPAYPPIARSAHASGAVSVQITVDEGGNVIAAQAVSGHPLLQAAAVAAARQASFRPTRLNGEPVRVNGLLVYNFVAQ
jgi:TonB family protein